MPPRRLRLVCTQEEDDIDEDVVLINTGVRPERLVSKSVDIGRVRRQIDTGRRLFELVRRQQEMNANRHRLEYNTHTTLLPVMHHFLVNNSLIT